jgi:signal transduction histidine kinase
MRDFVRSTAFRLAAGFGLSFLVIVGALAVFFYVSVRSELQSELDQRILAERDALLRSGTNDSARLADRVSVRTRNGVNDMYFALIGRDGGYRAGARVLSMPTLGWSDVPLTDADGKTDDGRFFATRLPDGSVLAVGADPESVERLDRGILPLSALAFGLLALAGVGGAFLLSAQLQRRVNRIAGTAQAIIDGDHAQRMTVDGSGNEFDRLAVILNRMLDRIDGLLTNVRQVSGDIAHDLRTPLNRLRQKLEIAAIDGGDGGAIQGAIADADEMLALFTVILTISEVEAGNNRLPARPLDLSSLVADIAESYLPAYEDSGRYIARDIEPDLYIDGQRESIAQLLVNLLDNALHHTPPGSHIAVTLAGKHDHVVLTIADNGPGIPEADRGRVFERFVRLERSRTTPGHGLGLRLVAAIASAHGAQITLEDNQPGARLMIIFKRSKPCD